MRRLLHGFINFRTIVPSSNCSSKPVLTALGRHSRAHAAGCYGRQSVDSRRIQVQADLSTAEGLADTIEGRNSVGVHHGNMQSVWVGKRRLI